MSKARTYILPIPVRGEASIFPMSAMPPRYALKMQNVYISENGGVKGVDAPMKNDMSAVANLGGSPPATAFKAHVHKGRVWMIERLNKLLATYSALNNPEDYTTANNAGYMDFKFLLPEGEELLDIITYIDLLVFFFKNYIAIYSGTNPTSSGDFALVQLIKGAGIAATDMAQMSGTDCIFLSQSGVKTLKQVVTTGDLNIGDASEALAPVLRSEIANASRFAATHYPKLGWLLLLIGSTVWIYQYTYKAWVRMVGADVLGMFGTTDGRLYLCGTGFLYQYDSGKTFAGVNIKWIWETAWLTLAKGLKAFLKLMEVITFPDTETTVNVQLSYDMNLSTMEHYMSFQSQPLNLQYIDAITDWDEVINFDEILYNIVRIPLFGAGKSVKMIFSNESAVDVEINDVKLQYTTGGL